MKKLAAFFSFFIIIGLVYYSFYSLMPRSGTDLNTPKDAFSTERALIHLNEIAKHPHYLGSDHHEEVRQYLIAQLKDLGLEVQEQTGFVLTEEDRSLIKPKNIIARLAGTEAGKSLVLLAHYDSAKVPSFGASDAGSGIVTILECMRAYLESGKSPKNDILVVFTDGEENGLDGAKLFVNEHPWAENVALALNFEARGSGGPSNMILETNQGNSNLIKAFIEANPKYPVTSSLMYSIYKMLPNDTDSTIFREDGDIDGFFFAFIDDHFDYHTANDTVENLDVNTLQHQGSYLLPLLHYFADADLSVLKSDSDSVYVNFPFMDIISYPFSWILWMLLFAIAVFIGLLVVGFKEKQLNGRDIGRGFAAFLAPLVLCGLIGFYGWKLIVEIYPHYLEIQHGFTYNGHLYIAFFVFLSLAILFFVYRKFKVRDRLPSFFVAPLTLWLVINIIVYLYLKGAAYFIIPVFFGLVSLWVMIRQERPNIYLLTLLAVPAIFIFSPLIQFFPVGLDLEMLVISCVFTVLTFGLVLPVLGRYKWKKLLTALSLLFAVIFFVSAHFKSDFTEDRKKPNSLVYYEDTDKNTSYWLTYDGILDRWTKQYLGDDPDDASKYVENAAGSKYNTSYTYAAETENRNIPKFEAYLEMDSIAGDDRLQSIVIIPQRKVHRLFFYTDENVDFREMEFNGKKVNADTTNNSFYNRKHKGFLRYSVTDNDSLVMSFKVGRDENVSFRVLEYSFDLMSNSSFEITPRPSDMMPKPFVNTDAVVVARTVNVNELTVKAQDSIQEISVVNE